MRKMCLKKEIAGIVSDYLNELKDDVIYDVIIEKHNEKRSSQANRYMWELLGQLSEKMGLNPVDEYRKRVHELGIYRQWELEPENVDTFKKIWESKGLSWIVEELDTTPDGKVLVNAYYGSSSYNTNQMNRLLSGVVQDCEAVGIPTLTPDEKKEIGLI